MQIKVESHQHVSFHFENFVGRVRIVSNVDKILDNRRIDVLIFACNKHGRHAYQLQFVSQNVGFLQIPINQIHCEIESFGDQFKVSVNFYEPIYEDSSLEFQYFRLVLHVGRTGKGWRNTLAR